MSRLATKNRSATRIARAAALMANGTPLSKAADIMGVTRQTLYRDWRKVDEEQVAQDALEYREVLRQAMPIRSRASKLIALTNAENPFASLRALERVDALCGIHAEPPREEHDAQPNVPLFALPPGTQMQIAVREKPAHTALASRAAEICNGDDCKPREKRKAPGTPSTDTPE